MKNPRDDAEFWFIDAPIGCGGVFTVGGQIVRGGAPIFNKLVGYYIDKLPPSYKFEIVSSESLDAIKKSRSED